MTGRQKMEAAFSKDGSGEIPVVLCYEDIFYRDHWEQMTPCPWWYGESPVLDERIACRRGFVEKTGQDWLYLPMCPSRVERENTFLDLREEGVFSVNRLTNQEERLEKPDVGGSERTVKSIHPERLIDSPAEIHQFIKGGAPQAAEDARSDGRSDLAARLMDEFGKDRYGIRHVGSPLWVCYYLWGFEGLMLMLAERPALVKHACRLYLDRAVIEARESAALGADAVWIEECFTDMISPGDYKELCLPFLRELAGEVGLLGMKSIHYFCGNPEGKLPMILSSGADAVAFEEGKKGFVNDIDELAGAVNGRCTLLGNLDSIGVLQNGTDEDLRNEISGQLSAGRRNKSRFVMSIGSPVTPATTPDRVRLYCDMAHEMGGR